MHTKPAIHNCDVPPTEPQELCLCHDMADCPDQFAIGVFPDELRILTELLRDLDEFLRCSNGVREHLIDFLATRQPVRDLQPDPDYLRDQAHLDANLLIDRVSFADRTVRGLLTQHNNQGDHQ